MKILHVIRDLARGTGGPVTALKGLAEAQVALGHSVTIVAGDTGAELVRPDGVQLDLVPLRPNAWGWATGFRQALGRHVPQCEILHGHMVFDYPVWEAARIARRYGKPFVLRPCGNLEAWSLQQKRVKKQLYLHLLGSFVSSASLLHFTSDGERADSARVTKRVDTRARVIPLGVLPECFEEVPDPRAFVRKHPEAAGRLIVLFLGRLHPKKQPNLALEAFAAAASGNNKLHLVLAGPGDPGYVSSLEARVRALGLEEYVTFTGLLDAQALREAYAAAAMFVLPSLQENFGIAVVEAMAARCPVVISDRVGIASDIIRAGAGFVSPAGVREIATSIERLANDSSLRTRMGENGRRLALDQYTWPAVARDVLAMYQDARAFASTGSVASRPTVP